jgi:uracil-DNA glycosylase
VILCLGKIGFDAILRYYKRRGWIERFSPYKFAHAAELAIEGAPTVLCSYHPSQQNTFTGKLTPAMMRGVFERAKSIIEDARRPREVGSGTDRRRAR